MRIPEYQNNTYNLKFWPQKSGKVKRIHEDKFKNQFEDSIKKIKSDKKKKRKDVSNEPAPKQTTFHRSSAQGNRFSGWS